MSFLSNILALLPDNISKRIKPVDLRNSFEYVYADMAKLQESRILTLGSITATTTTIDLAVHSSGVNSVQLDGEVLAKSTADHWEFAEVTAEEVFIIYATNSTEIFHLAENGMEIPADALIVATITISETGISIDEAVSGFREKAIDKWANLMASGGDMVLSLRHNQMRYRVSSGANNVRIGGFKNYVTDLLYSGIPLSIKNNTEGDIEFFNAVDESPLFIPIYSADLPFKIKKGETANFAWHTDNGFEIIKTGGGGAELPPGTNGQIYVIDNSLPEKIKPSDRLTNVENEIDAEIVNRALADNLLQAQIAAEKNRNDTQDGQIAGKLDKPTADGSWVVTKSGSTITYTDASTFGQNIANTNLTWSADRTQNLNGKKLSFTGGRFSVPALELEITAANSVPNKIWTDGADFWLTNNLGINRKITENKLVQDNYNPPTLAQIAAMNLFRGDYYKHIASGQISQFNGELLDNWYCSVAEWNALSVAQKNAVKNFNVY